MKLEWQVYAPKLLKDGDSVKILENSNIAKRLYMSKVGEWTEELNSVSCYLL